MEVKLENAKEAQGQRNDTHVLKFGLLQNKLFEKWVE